MCGEWHGERSTVSAALSCLLFFYCFKPLFTLNKPIRSTNMMVSFIYVRLPVKTLQLEQMAVVGSSEEPSVVASRMRLVFSTLEASLISSCQHI